MSADRHPYRAWLWAIVIVLSFGPVPANAQSTVTQSYYTSYSYQVPVTGFSFTIPPEVGRVIFNPAGTLATGTVTLPAAPIDGQLAVIISSKAITTLTILPSANQSAVGGPGTIGVGGRIECQYRLAITTWIC